MMSLDIIGTLVKTDYSDTDNVTHTTMYGYHVNSPYKIGGLDKWLVEPKTPAQVFFGVKTYFYCFENETQARELLELNDIVEE